MEPVRWITMNGNHVPIYEGQTEEEAINAFIGDKWEKELAKEEYKGEYGNSTTRYYLEGFGYVSKKHYDKAVEQGRADRYEIIEEKNPVQNLAYAKISKPEKLAKMTASVNPFYETDDYNWTYNCQRCVVAWEMRYRGYDVTAKARLREDNIFDRGTSWTESFENFRWNSLDSYYQNAIQDNVDLWENEMKKEGVGARFIVHLVWRKHRWDDKSTLSAHVVNAIVNSDGNIEYYDGQDGKKFRGWHRTRVQETSWARVDNLKLTDKVNNCVYDKGEEPQEEYDRVNEIKRQKKEYELQRKEYELQRKTRSMLEEVL